MEKDGWQIAFLSTSHLPAVTISIRECKINCVRL